MIPAAFEYERATSVDDAIAKLRAAGGTGKLIAGGHSLVPLMKLRLSQPAVLIDIAHIPDFAGVCEVDGGRIANVPRMLPDGLAARLDTDSWPIPPIFTQIQEDGGIRRDEMYRVFNMGLGMVLACDSSCVPEVLGLVTGAMEVGEVTVVAAGERVML